MFKFSGRHGCGPHTHQEDDHRHARDDVWPGDGRGMGHRLGRGGGGHLGRLFAHGDLRLVVLRLIADKPRHGYEIIKAIEDMAGGTYSPSPGTIYPVLTMLEEQGLTAQDGTDGAKKRYAITTEGQDYLAANATAVAALGARVRQAGATRTAAASPQIVRAIENLKLALRLRVEQGPVSDESIQTITTALDRAAGEIERS